MFGIIQRIKDYIGNSRLRQLLLLLLVLVTLPLIVFASQQKQDIRQRAGGGGVVLTLSPTSTTARIGEPLSVDVILQAGSHNITGVDFTLIFDNTILPINRFVPGTSFNAEVVNKIDPAASTFRYVATSTDPNVQITEEVRLGTLILEPKTAGQASLNFQSSQVTALGSSSGLSVSSENGSYVIASPVSPTIEPTATPSATPTVTLAPSPIASPTPTPIVPIITGVTPLQGAPGTRVVIRGENLLPPNVLGSQLQILLFNASGGSSRLASVSDGTATWYQTEVSFTIGNVPPQSGIITLLMGNVSARWPETFTILSAPTATPIPTNTPVPPTATPTPIPVLGDANGDGIVNILDYNIWRDEFLGIVSTKTSDFNRDGKIDLLDFNIWRTAFSSAPSPTSIQPTNAPTATRTPSPTPTRIPTPTITPTPTPLPASSLYKRVFVTNFTYLGRYVNGADEICRSFANNANLGGAWKAWISYPNNPAAFRLNRSTVPYKLLNGWTVANNWDDLTDGNLAGSFSPSISLTADMKNVDTYVWTGTTTSGNTSANTCSGWTSTSGGEFGDAGWSGNNDSNWTQSFQLRCGTSTGSGPAEGSFYCFEQ